MKFGIFVLSAIFLTSTFAEQSSGGPVYNFNFSTGASAVNTITPTAPTPNTLLPSATLESAKIESTNASVSDIPIFLRNNFKGMTLAISPKLNQGKGFIEKTGFYANYIFGKSLWGIRVQQGASNFEVTQGESAFSTKSHAVLVNKLVPIYNSFALDFAAGYQFGKILDFYTADPSYYEIEWFREEIISMYNGAKYNSYLASIGLNFYTENLLVGFQLQKNFGFEAKNINELPYHNKLKNLASFRVNIGLTF